MSGMNFTSYFIDINILVSDFVFKSCSWRTAKNYNFEMELWYMWTDIVLNFLVLIKPFLFIINLEANIQLFVVSRDERSLIIIKLLVLYNIFSSLNLILSYSSAMTQVGAHFYFLLGTQRCCVVIYIYIACFCWVILNKNMFFWTIFLTYFL